MTNKNERIALEWLVKEKNYLRSEIKRGKRGEPDFACMDGKRFEVKMLEGKRLVFTKRQFQQFKQTDIVLVFNAQGFLDEFKWKNRANIRYKISLQSPCLIDIDDKIKDRVEKYVKTHLVDFPTMKNFCDKAIRKELDRLDKE